MIAFRDHVRLEEGDMASSGVIGASRDIEFIEGLIWKSFDNSVRTIITWDELSRIFEA